MPSVLTLTTESETETSMQESFWDPMLWSGRGRVELGGNLGCDAVAIEAPADPNKYSGAGVGLGLKLGHAIETDTAFIACQPPLGWSMTSVRTFPRKGSALHHRQLTVLAARRMSISLLT